MVQVDVFWSYAMGAGLACAAQRQLESEEKPSRTGFFVKNLLFLSCLFAPSGIYLLWEFPGWETMFVGDRNLPAWLVAGFAITNVTQGILGFYVAYWLMRRGRIYFANLQWVFGYFAMFFILVHGWDGTGYQRFLYAGNVEQWRAGVEFPYYAFFYSNVALTLYAMGVILIPVLMAMIGRWTVHGCCTGLDAPPNPPSEADVIKNVLFTVLVLTLGGAVVASILIHWLGWSWGTAASLLVLYLVGLRKGGLVHRKVQAITCDTRV